MLRAPSTSILRWAVLCGYALLVALGHGGWHLVTGEQCGVHGHSHSHAPDTVTVCSHGHRHVHPATHHHVPAQKAPQHSDPHDSEQCAICAVFACPQTLAAQVELSISESVQRQTDILIAILATSNQTQLQESRGPPAAEFLA